MSSAEKTPVSLADLPPCPVETTLTLISDKWKVLILRDLLLHGTMRFGELKKSIGHVSQKVLTSQLRQMEQSACRIFPDGTRLQPPPDHGCDVGLGRGV